MRSALASCGLALGALSKCESALQIVFFSHCILSKVKAKGDDMACVFKKTKNKVSITAEIIQRSRLCTTPYTFGRILHYSIAWSTPTKVATKCQKA
jgi:hypothetical protein